MRGLEIQPYKGEKDKGEKEFLQLLLKTGHNKALHALQGAARFPRRSVVALLQAASERGRLCP